MAIINARKNVAAGIAAGIAGGLVASWVMDLFLKGLNKVKEAPQKALERLPEKPVEAGEGEDATQKTADAITYGFTGHPLSEEQKKKAGPIVHYSFGGLMGGLYGAIAELSQTSRLGFGTLFGTLLFIGADEIAVPALGLGKPPTQDSITNQVSHWAAHLVYGTTVEAVRLGVRRFL